LIAAFSSICLVCWNFFIVYYFQYEHKKYAANT